VESVLFKLDGASHDQRTIVSKVLRRLAKAAKKKPALARFISQTQQETESLQLANWSLTWSVPRVISQCEGADVQTVCVTVSHQGTLTAYDSNARALRALLESAISQALKYRVFKAKEANATRTLGDARFAEAEKQLKLVPASTTSCG
jgi:hypothetical protein